VARAGVVAASRRHALTRACVIHFLENSLSMRRLPLMLALAGVCLGASTAHGQEKQVAVKFVPSIRFDLIAGSTTAGHAGVSARVPFSNYFALGATAAAGISETGFSGRLDYFTRFSLDPYHYNAWEPYFGLGATTRMDSGGPKTRTYLLGFIGFEGPKAGRIAPGFEIGVGGGVRLGITLRFTDTNKNSSSERR
jgi:hypothetical protein